MNISKLLNNQNIKIELINYCEWLAKRYNKTLRSDYRIKYNALYPLLFNKLSENKQKEYYHCFKSSLNIKPIKKINKKGITMIKF